MCSKIDNTLICSIDYNTTPADYETDGPLVEVYTESLSVAAAIASSAPCLPAQRNPLQLPIAPSSTLPLPVPSGSPQTTTPPGSSTPVTTKSGSSHVLLTTTPISDSDVEKFLEKWCRCRRATGRPCCTLFSKEHYRDLRWQCAELTRDELDIVLIGLIMATLLNDPETSTKYRHTPTQRKLSSMAFSMVAIKSVGRHSGSFME